MTKLLKSSGTLALSLIMCFTMLFADIGTASAATNTSARGDVKEIKYVYPSSFSYKENTNGQWSIDENGDYFYRYTNLRHEYPRVFTVEYENGEEVTYSYYAGQGEMYYTDIMYQDNTGQKIHLYNSIRTNQSEEHFKLGKNNYCTFCFGGATKKIPVEITANSAEKDIKSIEYVPVVDEVDYSDSMMVYIPEKEKDQLWFSYYFNAGDKLIVTESNYNTKTYTYQDGYTTITDENDTEWVNAKFLAADGSEIDPDLVNIYDDQDLYEWSYGETCYLFAEYGGALTKVPITIKKNDVSSISVYVKDDSEEMEIACDSKEETYTFIDGIIVHKQDGSSEKIIAYENSWESYRDPENGEYIEAGTEGGFRDENGDDVWLQIMHKNWSKSGQWYVYYHGVSCPIKSSHDNSFWNLKTKPTCKTTGLYEGICTACGEPFDTAVIPIDENAHKFTNYTYNYDAKVGIDGTETSTCDYGCGNTDTRTKAGTALTDSSTIEGILADYYIYQFNATTGELKLSCKENATEPDYRTLENSFKKSSLYEYCDIVKKVHLSANVTPPKYSNYYYTFKKLEAFVVDEGNAYYSSDSGVLFNKEKTILYRYPLQKKDETYTIPSSVTEICNNKDDYPFESVRYLKTVNIPATLLKIHENSFVTRESGNGNSIECFIVDSENPNYKSVDGVLFSKDGKTLITFPSNKESDHYIIPDNVKKIGDNAFNSTLKLKKLTIPEGVEEIGSKAFLALIGYEGELTIPASVKKIGNEALGWLGSSGSDYRIINFTRNSKLEEFPHNAFSRLSSGALIRIPCKTWTVDLECTVELMHEGEWTTKTTPTCMTAGEKERICSVCTSTETANIPIDENAHKFTTYTYNYDAKVGINGTETATCDYGCGNTDTRTKAGTALNNSGSGGSSTPSGSNSSSSSAGGFAFPTTTVQQPTVSTDSSYTTVLGKDGSTLTISLADGYELSDVLVNGVSKGKVSSLSNLKTGDKVEIKTIKKTEVSESEKIIAELQKVTKTNFKARSTQVKLKNGKKAIKVTWLNTSGVNFDGIEIFRSVKKNSAYGKKPLYTSKSDKYYNTAIKSGTRYYYRVRGYIEVNGVKYYSDWSSKAWRTVK